MNTEYIINSLKTNLETYLSNELITIEHESSSTIVTPTPQEFLIGEHDAEVLTKYPSVLIWSPYSRKKMDIQGCQERQVWVRILTWITENDLSNLHKFLVRYSDAIGRILRDEEKTPLHTHNIVIEDSNNTDLYKTNVGYAQGCLLECTVDYIME
jgi:hypothetical protein